MKKYILLILILFLLFSITAFGAVIYKDIEEVTVGAAEEITIPLPTTDTILNDLLIVYISKDDPNPIDVHGDWTGICNEVGTGDQTLYMAYRIVTQADLDAPSKNWTWTETSGNEAWIGKILTYRGADTGSPIHASDTAFLDQDFIPIAPSVAFTNLTAGSLVLQVFGCDDDDGGYVTPLQLAERFNTAANDVGGAGGDTAIKWLSPTGHNDPDTAWTMPTQAYDDNLSSYSWDADIPPGDWSKYLELTIDPFPCSKIRFYAYYGVGEITEISLDVYYSDAWHNIYEGDFANLEWVEKAIGSTQTVSAMRAKFYNDSENPRAAHWYEADFALIMEGTGNTYTAVFEMGASEEWAAATVIIEAEAAAGLTWNTATITRWNTETVTKINTQ